MISFKEIADLSDAYDEETKKIGESRKEMWAQARAVLPPRDVSALKEAIRLRRKRAKDGDAVVDAHDDRVSEILSEITPRIGHARAPSAAPYDPVAEAEWFASLDDGGVAEPLTGLAPLPPHDEVTGEIIEPTTSAQPAIPAHLVPEGGVSAVIGSIRAGRADEFGKEDENSSNNSNEIDLTIPDFLRREKAA